MTTKRLPERPSLEQLKRQAKELLRSAQDGSTAALERFRILPAFASHTDDQLARAGSALHDAQSVIAREHGFPSWNALRRRVEELTLDIDAAVVEFIEAATEVRPDRAARLLTTHPGIAGASFHVELILGDLAAIEARLASDPGLATRPGGPRGWEPLLYVCHCAHRLGDSPDRSDGLVAVAGRLIELGADANGRFPWLHHGVRRPVLWGAAHVTRLLPLAELLVESGADPDDGVTFPLAAAGGDVPVLELLLAHGADVNQRWASDGSATLYAMLQWGGAPTGLHWLLEHGAGADPVFAENGETPLHLVAARWDPASAELLVRHGADVTRARGDGRTPYAVAEINGNRPVADWLLEHGAADDLSDVDRLVATCSRGDLQAARAMLATRPDLHDEISDEHYAALYRAAERNDTRALGAMLACGFDPDRGDAEIGKTALHVAAMEGWPDAVRTLLSHGASVAVRDREFLGQPLVWAAEGSGAPHRDGRDHAEVGRLLLEAGSPVEWETGDEPSDRILEVLEEWRRAVASST